MYVREDSGKHGGVWNPFILGLASLPLCQGCGRSLTPVGTWLGRAVSGWAELCSLYRSSEAMLTLLDPFGRTPFFIPGPPFHTGSRVTQLRVRSWAALLPGKLIGPPGACFPEHPIRSRGRSPQSPFPPGVILLPIGGPGTLVPGKPMWHWGGHFYLAHSEPLL